MVRFVLSVYAFDQRRYARPGTRMLTRARGFHRDTIYTQACLPEIMCTNISNSTPPLSRSLIVLWHRFSGILVFCPNRHKPFACLVVERPILPSCSATTTETAKQDLLSACVRYSTPRPAQLYHRRAIRTGASRREVTSEQHPTEPKPDISTVVGSREWLTVRLEPMFSSSVCHSQSRAATLRIEKRQCFRFPLPPSVTVSWSSPMSSPISPVRLQAAS